MNTNANQSVSTEAATEIPATQAKAPRKSKLAKAIAAVSAMNQDAVNALVAEVIALRANQKEVLAKLPVDSDKLTAATAQLVAEAKADLAKDNPKATPNLSLSGILGFIPQMTKEQAKGWRTARDAMRKDYSNRHRELWGKRNAILKRVSRDKGATLATVANKRKDGTYSKVSLSAKQAPKAKAKGPKAKPDQVAAQMPVAGNAVNPATV